MQDGAVIILPADDVGTAEPVLVLLHSFSSSRREWRQCADVLAERHRRLSIDLPGHGAASTIGGYDVEAMRQAVTATMDGHGLRRCVIVGHSMSGKIAMAIAADRADRVAGLVLVSPSPSPPSPEPITDGNRRRMLAIGRRRGCAEDFLDDVTAAPLVGDGRDQAVDDFLACSPAAWVAWLEGGSREDWSDRVGVLQCPALILVGDHDPAMPEFVHRRLTMPHLADAELRTLPDCGHLPPRECPDLLAELVADFVRRRIETEE